LQQREDQVFLVLAPVIGALTGLAVVAFILLTEREGMRVYPVGSDRWRRLLFPVAGSLGTGPMFPKCLETTGPKSQRLLPPAVLSDIAAFLVSSPMGVQPADEVALQVAVWHAVKSITGCSSHTDARQQRGLVGSMPQS